MEEKTSVGQRTRIGISTKVFAPELVDAAMTKHSRAEKRRRLLPARLVDGLRE
ncbi:transposase domain-containing protein [Streptomyces sp. NPDC007205]|uniref:transposase domain-containing protein n=1 Tax=Streptomyces sp. NPDC007205 TaxID=3154316 RepID=UPI0033D2E049